MKKSYKTPRVEVVKFQYSDQVVASSISYCQRLNKLVSGTNADCSSPEYTK